MMKIDNGIKPLTPGLVPENDPRPARPGAPEAPMSSSVRLSSIAARLGQAEQAIADTPVVDARRVAELTLAIRENRYNVDAGKVADKLLAATAEALRATKG